MSNNSSFNSADLEFTSFEMEDNDNIVEQIVPEQPTNAELQQLMNDNFNLLLSAINGSQEQLSKTATKNGKVLSPVIVNIHDDISVSTTDSNIRASSVVTTLIIYNTIDANNDSDNDNNNEGVNTNNNNNFQLVHKVIAMINATTMGSIMAKITSTQMLGNYVINIASL
jgi:hypothetical protein